MMTLRQAKNRQAALAAASLEKDAALSVPPQARASACHLSVWLLVLCKEARAWLRAHMRHVRCAFARLRAFLRASLRAEMVAGGKPA